MISRGVEISIAGGGEEKVRVFCGEEKVRAYLLVVLSFFFCNHAFIVFRYKKPHAALAMEKTKPINQKPITNESHGTNLISTNAQVSPPPGQRPHITRKVQTNNLAV